MPMRAAADPRRPLHRAVLSSRWDDRASIQMSGKQIHRTGVFVLSTAMAAIGLALIVEAFTFSGSLVSHLLLGALFFAAGVGRFYVELRRGRRSS